MDVKDYIKLLHNLKILEIKVASIFEKRLEISLTRFQIIKYLYEVEVATPKQLAQSLEIDAAAITRHLKILEEGEYITKRRNEHNILKIKWISVLKKLTLENLLVQNLPMRILNS